MSHLKQSVVEILQSRSQTAANEFSKRFLHPKRTQSNESLLVADLNTFWRIELTKLPQDTISAREALMDNISGLEWLELFERYVAPTVVLLWPSEDRSHE